jgi:hypothetical protein
MIRTLNFAFIAMTGLVCLGLYRIAEEARVAQAELRSTRAAIARENDMLTVLGAEWARLTQPARIQALASRHLQMSDAPTLELSSLTALPNRAAPQNDTPIREANIIVPSPAPARRVTLATYPGM